MNKYNLGELIEKDQNFKKIHEKLISGNKKYLDNMFKQTDEVDNLICNSDKNKSQKLTNTTANSIKHIEKLINFENKNTKFFVFSCIDCEINIPALFGLNQEEVFVYKNIGNIIISKDLNLLCAIQYAIEILNIRNFIVLGHINCLALKEGIYPSKNGIINKWVKNIRIFAEENRHMLYESKKDHESYELNLSLINIKEQMKRFSKLSLIQNINNHGEKVYIHGFQLLNSMGNIINIDVLYSNV